MTAGSAGERSADAFARAEGYAGLPHAIEHTASRVILRRDRGTPALALLRRSTHCTGGDVRRVRPWIALNSPRRNLR